MARVIQSLGPGRCVPFLLCLIYQGYWIVFFWMILFTPHLGGMLWFTLFLSSLVFGLFLVQNVYLCRNMQYIFWWISMIVWWCRQSIILVVNMDYIIHYIYFHIVFFIGTDESNSGVILVLPFIWSHQVDYYFYPPFFYEIFSGMSHISMFK